MAKKVWLSSFLVMVILASSIYFVLPDKVRIDIEKTRTKYSVWINDSWDLAATEYVNLYDGSKKMRAKSRELNNWTDGYYVYVSRTSKWKENITTIQTYVFDPNTPKEELTPLKNIFECMNCEGKIVHYEVRDISYNGATKEITSPFSFGKQMKIEWQDGAYYSKVFQQKSVDKIIIKYRPQQSHEVYRVRLFDPPIVTAYIDGTSADADVEMGPVNISGTSTTGTGPPDLVVCLDTTHPAYGVNYTCAENETSFIFDVQYFRKEELNNTDTARNITCVENINSTVYLRAHQWDVVKNFTINLTGFPIGGSLPSNLDIFVNDTLTYTISGTLNSSALKVEEFDDSSTYQDFNSTTPVVHTAEFRIPKTATVVEAYVNVSGFSFWSEEDDTEDEADNLCQFTTGSCTNLPYGYDENISTAAEVKSGEPVNVDTMFIWENYTWNVIWTGDMTWNYTGSVPGGSPWQVGEFNVSIYNHSSSSWKRISSTGPGTGTQTVEYDFHVDDFGLNSTNKFRTQTIGTGVSIHSSTKYFEGSLSWDINPSMAYVEAGTPDGDREWNHTALVTTTTKSENMSTAINSFLENCTADVFGYCDVPLYVYSGTAGGLNLTNLYILYTGAGWNPVSINITHAQSFLDATSSTWADIPLKFESATNGTLEISDINFDYAGGNQTYEITAHNSDYSAEDKQNATFFYSRFELSFPQHISALEFIPRRPTSKNVTPYGQTATRPVLNVTPKDYDGPGFNFSMYMNETYSCVNLTVGNSSTKSASQLLGSETWYDLQLEATDPNYFGLWMWADYACNFTAWRLWEPEFFFRGCCLGCVCDIGVS